jgi:hypothetical protein
MMTCGQKIAVDRIHAADHHRARLRPALAIELDDVETRVLCCRGTATPVRGRLAVDPASQGSWVVPGAAAGYPEPYRLAFVLVTPETAGGPGWCRGLLELQGIQLVPGRPRSIPLSSRFDGR